MEQTFNRDSKTKGGIVGFTLNRTAVKRWILAQSERGSITRQCHVVAGHCEEERLVFVHHEQAYYIFYSLFSYRMCFRSRMVAFFAKRALLNPPFCGEKFLLRKDRSHASYVYFIAWLLTKENVRDTNLFTIIIINHV